MSERKVIIESPEMTTAQAGNCAVGAPRPARVLMLLENGPYSRDARVPNEATSLVSAGHKVTVVCPAGPQQPWHEFVDGVHIYHYPPPINGTGFMAYVLEYGYSMVAAFLMSLYVLLHDGFEVVHAHCPPDAFVFLAAFYKLLGKRFVYDHHDLAPELYCARFGGRSNRVVHGILLWLERLCCQLADHVIATNESYKAIEMRRGGVPEQRITVVRNGPGAHHMRLSKPVSGLRQDGRRILCYVGCIGFQDRVDYLLRALHHLLYTLGRADFLCVVVGAGEAWPALQELTDQLHLADHVHFVGWVQKEQVPSYISAADICVAPEPSNSYNDRSTAVKLVEYMATGKPIVAFDLPEHRFTAQDAAAYAQPNDELHFAQQIAALMDDPDRRRRMGQVGRQRVEAELAWQHQERKLLAAYQTVCGMDPVRT